MTPPEDCDVDQLNCTELLRFIAKEMRLQTFLLQSMAKCRRSRSRTADGKFVKDEPTINRHN